MNSKAEEEGKVTKKSYVNIHRIVDIVIVLVFLLYGILRLSSVQTFLVQHIASYLSKELKTEITIGGVDISWFLDVVIEDLKVKDQKRRPILDVHKLVVNVKSITRTKRIFKIGSIRLVKADIRMIRYAKDSAWNYSFLVDYFTSAKKKPTTSKPWSVSMNSVDLSGCRLLFQDQKSDTITRGICYSNLRIKELNLRIKGLRTDKDTIFGKIRNLSAKEQCGLDLKEFRAEIKLSPVTMEANNLHIVTNRSDLRMNLRFEYPNFKAFNNFVDSVNIHSRILTSDLNMEDLGFFVTDVQGMNNLLKFEGDFSGKVNNLRAMNFKFEYGKNTRFNGNITLSGLPNIYETFMHLSIRELKTSIADIRTIKLPGGTLIPLLPTYNKIGSIGIKGFFTGFYNDFVSYADYKTDAGDFSTDLAVHKSKSPVYISYKGKLKGKNVDVGNLFMIKDYIGKLNMDLQVEGKGIDLKNLDAHFVGSLDSLDFKGNKIDNITLSGAVKQKAFSGIAKIRDALVNLDFDGKFDLNKKLPIFNFTAWLHDVKLSKLKLIARDTSATLTAHMNLNFEGTNLDNLLGKLEFDSTLYSEKGKILPIKSLVLETHEISMGDKQVLLRSDYLDGDISGMYSFSHFYNSLNLILNKYLPSLRFWNAVGPTDQFPQNFFYYLTFKNPDPVMAIFAPELKLGSNSTIKGSFSAPKRNLVITADAASIKYMGVHYHNFYLNGYTSNNQLFLTSGASKIAFKEDKNVDTTSLGIDSVRFLATVAGDSIRYRIKWNDLSKINHNKGDIYGFAEFRSLSRINLGITHGLVMLKDSIWTINPNNSITIDSTNIAIENLGFSGRHDRLLLQGSISNDPNKKLNIYFQQVDISNLDKLINVYGVDINGVADGSVSLMNLYHSPNLTSNLKILGLEYNKVKLGDATIKSSWNDDAKALLVDLHVVDVSNPANTEPLSVTGTYYPYAETDNFNFNIELKDLQLRTINPFLDSFMSGLNGLASGNLQFLGNTNYPYLKGVVNCKKTSFKIDYLNTKYKFDDKVTFDKDLLTFENFTFKDTLDHTGVVNGVIRNKAFNKWSLDLSIVVNNLLGFNKGFSYSEMYYGKAVGSGLIKITGPVDNLNFAINAKTERGTNLFIPLNNPGTVSENNFITFVNKKDSTKHLKDQWASVYSGLSMNMDINVTDNAAIQLFLPYDMGNIKGTGNGQIKMGIDNIGDFTIFGDYRFTNGSFQFTMPKYTLSRTFNILDGGFIRWSGSPYAASINLQAAYKTKVSLSSLPNNASQLSQRIAVNCVISLKGNLFKPSIKFSFNLPESDEATKQLVYSAIDTTNVAEMNQQMISLLMVGQFSLYNETKSLASSLSAQPYELISSQLNNMLSQISTEFDIGFNYRPGDNLTQNEVELMLSKQLFNDRMRVEVNGNFGVSNNNTSSLQRSSNLVGDVNIEYKLTPDGQFMVKAYNRTNRDIFDIFAPYKQGLGISYRKQFDYFRDIFRKKNKVVKPAK